MSRPTLRVFDGSDNTSPDLKDEVKELQQELNKEGFKLNETGLFDRDTETAVKRFQRDHNLNDDGVVGPLTWSTLLKGPEPDLPNVFPTTYPRNNPSLMSQLAEIPKYRSFIEANAAAFLVPNGIPLSIMLGIGSRESHWGLFLKPAGAAGTGDATKRRFPTAYRTDALPPDGGGYGRGLLQIDFDAHEFARTGNWKDPNENIKYGCKVLVDTYNFIKRKTTLAGRDALQAALAGYNCGAGNVLSAIRDGRDIDFYTAGRDYSKDVLNRTGWFQLNGFK